MDGQDSYGIPYNVEGYGYIVDKEMIAALVGEDNVDSFIENIKQQPMMNLQILLRR